MPIIADLHLHSKYAQATSRHLDLDSLSNGARRKGIDLLGTGDFTHPKWREELNKLEESEGIYTYNKQKFLLSTEISLIYKDKGKGRRTHNLVLAPSLEVVDQITDWLLQHGRVDYDGRPIFGISCPEFVERLKEISQGIEVIPAHIWTPWFSMFGSRSGWDSMQDCFEDQTKRVKAIETGLSSNPADNWRLPQLDTVNIVSFSDAHSAHPWRLGREATILDAQYTYASVREALTGNGVLATLEVDPNYGKYHFDGHRKCGVRFSPQQTKQHKGMCPVCKTPVVVGVANRIEELAQRDEQQKREGRPGFETLLPLHEVISAVYNVNLQTKTVARVYEKFMQLGTEFAVLRELGEEVLQKADPFVAKAILKQRSQRVLVEPGYDGVYGKPDFGISAKKEKQQKLF